jgi:hypothetical protein
LQAQNIYELKILANNLCDQPKGREAQAGRYCRAALDLWARKVLHRFGGPNLFCTFAIGLPIRFP